MKIENDNLEWHDENELVKRLDVVEAVLNLADTIDDVVDVIMSVPTYKVQTSTNVAMGSDSISTKADRKTENSSEKPNNCEHITEDGVTCAKYPACDDCLDNPLNKVKGSERFVKGSEQTDCDTCIHNKLEWYSEVCDGCSKAHSNYEPKDEPQTEGIWNAGYKTGYDKGYKDAQKVKDSQDLVKDLVKDEPQTDCPWK